MCGGQEEIAARVCRNCGERLVGVQGPDGWFIENVWRDGNLLVMAKGAKLPALCVKTNQPTSERVHRKLYWHPSWVYLTLIFPPLVGYLLVVLFTQHCVDVEFGLCRQRKIRQRWVKVLVWCMVLAGFALCSSFCVIPFPRFTGPASQFTERVLAISGVILVLTGLVTAVIFTRLVSPAKITSRYIWLKGIHPDYVAGLPSFPGDE